MISFILAQSNDIPTWALIISAILASGILTAVLNYLFDKKKNISETAKIISEIDKVEADAADIIQRAAGELIGQMRAQLESSEAQASEVKKQNILLMEQNERVMIQNKTLVDELEEMKTTITDLKTGIALLSKQLKEHGINPVYPPSPPAF